jgi:2-C-methyl-D-erythritol 4-phosphate cytidylyltransferase
MHTPHFWVIIPAAGIGKRFGADQPKQYLSLQGKPVIAHTLACFIKHPLIHKIVTVIEKDDTDWPSVRAMFPAEKIITAIGGTERHLSVYQGLLALQAEADPHDWVLVHDAVRPCLQQTTIDHLIAALQDHPVGGLLGIRVRDTLKKTDQAGNVIATIDRKNAWQAQTPQMFRYGLLSEALKTAIDNDQHVTDEASAIELLGKSPLMINGLDYNIKITYSQDLQWAESYLANPKHISR